VSYIGPVLTSLACLNEEQLRFVLEGCTMGCIKITGQFIKFNNSTIMTKYALFFTMAADYTYKTFITM